MADQQRELKLVLTLEGKQFTAVLNTNIISADKLAKNVDKITVSKIKAEKATKTMTGSITDLNNRLKQATDIYNSLTPASGRYEKAQKRIAVLTKLVSNATAKSTKDLSNFGAATGTTGFAVLNMNRVISDAPFGMIAISNNIEPLVQSFIHLKNEAGGVKGAFLTLGKSMIGPLGVMTAISLVTSALTFYSLNTNRAKEKTKELAQEAVELDQKIRLLEGTFKDIVQAESNYTKKILEENIEIQQTAIEGYKRLIERGGITVRGEFQPFSREQIAEFQNNIDKAKQKITEYYEQIKNGNPYTQKNISLLKELADVASNEGANGINKFAEKNKLSKDQLSSLTNLLKNYSSAILSVSGGLAKELPEGFRKVGIQIGLQKKETENAIKALDDYWDAVNGKSKSGKGNKRDTNLFSVEPAKIELGGLTAEQDKLLKELKTNFLQNGLEWNSENQAYAYNIVLNLKQVVTDKQLKPVKRGKDPAIEYVIDSLDELQRKSEEVNKPIMLVMNTMVEGFLSAKTSIREVVNEVGLLITKMIIMAGLQKLVNTTVLGPLGLLPVGVFHKGGIVGLSNEMSLAYPKMFTNAQKFHTGGIVGTPAILQEGEAVYTAEMQKNMFKFFAGNMAAQLNRSTINYQPQPVEIIGSVGITRRSFFAKFEKFDSYNKRLTRTFKP